MSRPVLDREVNRRIGQALHRYRMTAQDDHLLVAVSGGLDSLVCAWLLGHWRAKAPVDFAITCVHVARRGEEPGRVRALREALAAMGHDCQVLEMDQDPLAGGGPGARGRQGACFRCARIRRRLLFDLARRLGCNRLVLGHHRDDLLETFLLNVLCAGNISTMRPRQDLFGGRLAIIRPLAFVDRAEVRAMAARAGIQALPSTCPLGEDTRRRQVRRLLERLEADFPGARASMFAALGNVRQDYLLDRGREALAGGETATPGRGLSRSAVSAGKHGVGRVPTD